MRRLQKPITQIPNVMTEVDANGKETHHRTMMGILPPKPGTCIVCAHPHDPDQPHNAQSLYYATVFHAMNGRTPTWADALAHCGDKVREVWTLHLKDRKAWTEPPRGERPIVDHGTE